MCPPPIDPILPLGPVAGGSYVDRASSPGRVTRRHPRDQQGEEQRGHAHHDEDDDDGVAPRWIGSRTPAADAGAYDDHGRIGHADADDLPGITHVDRTA